MEPSVDRDVTVTVLSNGLTVVVGDAPGATSATLAVHVRGGGRSDPAGAVGRAHLAEHVMTQDRCGPSGAQLFESVRAGGGRSSATTRLDHLEFVHVVADGVLEELVRAEAARLCAPGCPSGDVEVQRRGVLEEIERNSGKSPLGAFPWPVLGTVLFDRDPNRRDTYGEPADVAAISEEQLSAYRHRHVRPDGVVVTGVADLARHPHLLARLADAFGELPARTTPAAATSSAVEDLLPKDRRRELARAGATAVAVAAGWRLPPVAEEPERHLGRVLLARLLSVAPGRASGHLAGGCGRFGELDCTGTDALAVVARPSSGDPEDALADVDARLRALADPAVAAAVLDRYLLRAVTVLTDHRRSRSGWAAELGRSTLLWGDPRRVGGWWERLGAMGAADLSRAAAELASEPRAEVILRPGDEASPPPPRTAPPRTRPTPVPFHAGTLAPWRGSAVGEKVLLLDRPGAPATWIRARWSVPGPSGFARHVAENARRALAALPEVVRATAASASGEIRMALELTSVDVSPGRLRWEEVVAEVLTATTNTDIPPTGGPGADDCCQDRLFSTVPLGPPRLLQLVVLGDTPHRYLPANGVPAFELPEPRPTGDVLVSGADEPARLVLRWPGRSGRRSALRRYLLTSVLSGVGRIGTATPAPLPSGTSLTQESVAGTPCLVLRADAAGNGPLPALLRPVIHGVEPHESEIVAAGEFAVGQWSAVTDDPRQHSDTAAMLLAVGVDAHDVLRLGEQLSSVTPEDVRTDLAAGLPLGGATGVFAGPEPATEDVPGWRSVHFRTAHP